MGYKSLKVPEWVYANAISIQNKIARDGFAILPEHILRPDYCPLCGEEVEVEGDYVACSECSYQQQTIDESGSAPINISLGLILGLGLASLLSEIESESETDIDLDDES